MKSKIWLIKSRAIPTMLIFLACLCAFTPKSWARYSGGTGEPNNPYQIATAEDLNDIGNYEEDWDKNFVLANDVNLAGRIYTTAVIAPDVNNANYEFDGTAFTGVFDGNDHKIMNLVIDGGVNSYLGLFGSIYEGEVRNLRLEGASFSGRYFVGGLVGANGDYYHSGGAISNCYSIGDVNGVWVVGGLVGGNSGTISDCYSTCSVIGEEGVGGLVGINFYASIQTCYSTGSVSGEEGVGGLVGLNDGNISNCYSTGNVKGTRRYIGGLVGHNGEETVITNSYSTGSVSGSSNVGGLVGWNDYGTITNCYSTGSVSGTGSYSYYVGGLVGINNDGSVLNCYSTSDVNGYGVVGGLVGENGWYGGTITNCYSNGSVRGDDSVGGLVGWNYWGGSISNCYSKGSVSGDGYVGGLVGNNYRGSSVSNCYSTGGVNGVGYVGGLIGSNDGSISNCYSTNSVIGHVLVGGLVGYNCYGTISNCYSTGSVSGTDSPVGGLVGAGNPYFVTSSFWDKDTSGQTTSVGGTPKTTTEMKTKSTFTDAGWDFVEIWGIGEHQTYPYLRFAPAGDSNYDKKIDLLDLAILASHWLEEK